MSPAPFQPLRKPAGDAGPSADEQVIEKTGREQTEEESPVPSVDDEDVSILRVLEKRRPLRLTQDQIAAATKPRVSRRTVAERMPQLEKEGLVQQPRGKKQGYVITAKGSDLLRQIDSTTS
jgi:predicted transcriptional regulator